MRSTTSSSASRASAFRSRTRPRSRCSPTSRRGCGTTSPAEFLCALMNAQPMGFYPPSSLVRDAQRRGIEVRPPHVNRSDAKCAIEDGDACGSASATSARWASDEADGGRRRAAVRRRRPTSRAARLSARRARGARRVGRVRRLGPAARAALAARRDAAPRERGRRLAQLALPIGPTAETPELPAQTDWERMLADYRHTSLSVGVHPLELLRPHLDRRRLERRARDVPHGAQIAVAGHGGRAPAPGDREGHRLHAARGRARPDQPDRPAAGLRGAPRASSAASR